MSKQRSGHFNRFSYLRLTFQFRDRQQLYLKGLVVAYLFSFTFFFFIILDNKNRLALDCVLCSFNGNFRHAQGFKKLCFKMLYSFTFLLSNTDISFSVKKEGVAERRNSILKGRRTFEYQLRIKSRSKNTDSYM